MLIAYHVCHSTCDNALSLNPFHW